MDEQIRYLCAQLKVGNVIECKRVLQSLSENLRTNDYDISNYFLKCGGGNLVMRLMEVERLSACAMYAISILAEKGGNIQAQLTKVKLFTSLCEKLSKLDQVTIAQSATFLLSNLVSKNERGQLLAEVSGCTEQLTKQFCHLLSKIESGNEKESENSLVFLSNCSRSLVSCMKDPTNANNQATILQCIGPNVIHGLKSAALQPILSTLLQTLAAMAFDNSAAQNNLQAKGVLPILHKRLLEAICPTVQDELLLHLLSAITAILSHNEATSREAGEIGLISLMLEVAEMSLREDVQLFLAMTLATALEHSDANRELVLENGGSDLVTRAFSSSLSPELNGVMKYILHLLELCESNMTSILEGHVAEPVRAKKRAAHSGLNDAADDDENMGPVYRGMKSLHKKFIAATSSGPIYQSSAGNDNLLQQTLTALSRPTTSGTVGNSVDQWGFFGSMQPKMVPMSAKKPADHKGIYNTITSLISSTDPEIAVSTGEDPIYPCDTASLAKCSSSNTGVLQKQLPVFFEHQGIRRASLQQQQSLSPLGLSAREDVQMASTKNTLITRTTSYSPKHRGSAYRPTNTDCRELGRMGTLQPTVVQRQNDHQIGSVNVGNSSSVNSRLVPGQRGSSCDPSRLYDRECVSSNMYTSGHNKENDGAHREYCQSTGSYRERNALVPVTSNVKCSTNDEHIFKVPQQPAPPVINRKHKGTSDRSRVSSSIRSQGFRQPQPPTHSGYHSDSLAVSTRKAVPVEHHSTGSSGWEEKENVCGRSDAVYEDNQSNTFRMYIPRASSSVSELSRAVNPAICTTSCHQKSEHRGRDCDGPKNNTAGSHTNSLEISSSCHGAIPKSLKGFGTPFQQVGALLKNIGSRFQGAASKCGDLVSTNTLRLLHSASGYSANRKPWDDIQSGAMTDNPAELEKQGRPRELHRRRLHNDYNSLSRDEGRGKYNNQERSYVKNIVYKPARSHTDERSPIPVRDSSCTHQRDRESSRNERHSRHKRSCTKDGSMLRHKDQEDYTAVGHRENCVYEPEVRHTGRHRNPAYEKVRNHAHGYHTDGSKDRDTFPKKCYVKMQRMDDHSIRHYTHHHHERGAATDLKRQKPRTYSPSSSEASPLRKAVPLLPPQTRKTRQKRQVWSTKEVKWLLHGVRNMGKYWSQILATYNFHPHRTAVDLKEKYHRLQIKDGSRAGKPQSPHSTTLDSYGFRWQKLL